MHLAAQSLRSVLSSTCYGVFAAEEASMKLTSAALIGLLLAAGYAHAQTPAPAGGGGATAANSEAVRKACKEEAKHLCAGKQGQEAMSCLKSNADKLSPKCKDAVSK
jgi:hypothetical protein